MYNNPISITFLSFTKTGFVLEKKQTLVKQTKVGKHSQSEYIIHCIRNSLILIKTCLHLFFIVDRYFYLATLNYRTVTNEANVKMNAVCQDRDNLNV